MPAKKKKKKKKKKKYTQKLTESLLVKTEESSPSSGYVTVTLFTRLEMQITSE